MALTDQLERQKRQLRNVAEEKLQTIKQLCFVKMNKTKRIEEMFKRSENEGLEMAEGLENAKSKEIEPAECRSRMEIKLNTLLKKVKAEIVKPNYEWLGEESKRDVILTFEKIIKTILKKKVSFQDLAEGIAHVREEMDKNEVCNFSSLPNIQ